MKKFLLVGLFLFTANEVNAQSATPASTMSFNQAASSLAVAQAYTYKYYPDSATTGIVTNFTCSGATSPFLCTGAIPAFTPGSHTLQVTASNAAGESPKSNTVTFTMVVIPAAPTGLTINP